MVTGASGASMKNCPASDLSFMAARMISVNHTRSKPWFPLGVPARVPVELLTAHDYSIGHDKALRVHCGMRPDGPGIGSCLSPCCLSRIFLM